MTWESFALYGGCEHGGGGGAVDPRDKPRKYDYYSRSAVLSGE